MKYRADIDGLRAIAIVPVVLFHAGIEKLSGGFVGVDIFFVISGFLITRVISNEISADRFSFLTFYERRIRRILPALVVILIFCSIAGSMLFLPRDLENYNASLFFSDIFLSNIYFLRTSGYFADAAETKPLLHLWSLCIEEQFYIFFPIYLILIARLFNKRWIFCIAPVAAVSFALSVWVVSRHSQTTAFFLLPTRAWELLLGSSVSFAPPVQIKSRLSRELLSALALILIIGPVLTLTSQKPFPGINGLSPCLGAAMLLFLGSAGATLTSRLLSSAPFVFIGLISYSLYLWHWPLIVFYKYWLVDPMTNAQIAEVIGCSFLMAAISWRVIERPFRKSAQINRQAIFSSAIAAMLLIAIVGGSGYLSQNRFSNFSEEGRKLDQYSSEEMHLKIRDQYHYGTCFLGEDYTFDLQQCLAIEHDKKNYFLVGDSHAADLIPGLNTLLPGIHFLQATAAGCRALYKVATNATEACKRINKTIFDSVSKLPVSGVILASRWEKSDILPLKETIEYLKEYSGNIILVGPAVEYKSSLPSLLLRTMRKEGDYRKQVANQLIQDKFDLNESLRTLANEENIKFLSVTDAICPHKVCDVFVSDEVPWQWDYGHLTVEGSNKLIEEWLQAGFAP